MESAHPADPRVGTLEVRMLGPLSLRRNDVELALPASRKVRALLAYLLLSPVAVGRSELCELLWDVPNDPRGELRWCLSKIRQLVDEPETKRVRASRDAIGLDLAGASVDALAVARALESRHGDGAVRDLQPLAAMFRGELLEGLEIDRSPAFNSWLVAQRRRYRGLHAALLERVADGVPDAEALGHLETLVRIAPFDVQAHGKLLAAFARCAMLREGEAHLEAAMRLFESEQLETSPLRDAWRQARTREDAIRSTVRVAAPPAPEVPEARDATGRTAPRASIAVMPFIDRSAILGAHGGAADALAYDVIARLAKLRTMFVIAQGTVFALHARGIGAEEAGRMLGVDYVVGGALLRRGEHVSVRAELIEARTARVIWTEAFEPRAEGALGVLESIGDRIVASVAAEVETIERNRAVLKAPSSLDAWEAHHRGLWHMFRFTRDDNAQARHFFELAARLDPTFSRPHAGISFTHWQDAFQGWTADRQAALNQAQAAAGQSLLADDRDPAAHWALGRALWLRGRHDEAVAELEQSIDLSPNFALAHYNLAFVHSTAGDAKAAIAFSDHSRELSPFDPMLFGMFGARAMALARLGRFDEAAEWGVKAAARPNSFPHIRGIAAFSLALADRLDEARAQLRTLHEAAPGYRFADFQRAFRFDANGAQLFRKGARKLGVT
ncbi:MAG: tetratricopeptide repeat protein [Alphaproteobacteria bacterium]|nr:tetratricopeptide repeat protein [Alphaproteobacteria bacterium]